MDARQFRAETTELPKVASHPRWTIVMQMSVKCKKARDIE